MPPKMMKFTFRTDQETLKKLHYIADNNFRTLNKELEMLGKRHITSYEEKYGPIILEPE